MGTRRTTAAKQANKPSANKAIGRPTKQAGEVADVVVTSRWTPSDKAILDALVSDERANALKSGLLEASAERINAADVLRSLVRKEAKARGLMPAPVDG